MGGIRKSLSEGIMKILAVIETDIMSKGPHQTHHLLERLSTRGHEVRLIDYEITWRQKNHRPRISSHIIIKNFSKAITNSRLTLIRPRIIYLPLIDYVSEAFTYFQEICKQIKEFDSDVVMGFSILNTYIAMMLSKIYRIPFVYYLIDAQHTQIPEKFLRLVGKAVEIQIAKNADRVLVINEELGRYAIGLGVRQNNILVLRAGIDPQRFNPNISGEEVRKKYNIKDDEIVLFFMGWIYSFSGIKEVADTLLKHKSNEKFRLMVVGKGDFYEDLREMKQKGLGDRLILVDWRPYDEVPKYIAAADICLLPAYNNEVMRNIVPIKMYEYMACGKPVIATRLPGIVKEFGHDNGVIYVDGPVDVLRKAIELINNGDVKKHGIRAWEFVKKHSWEKITDEFEKILKEIVDSSRKKT